MDGPTATVHDPGGDVPTVVFVHGSLDRGAAFIRVQRHLSDLRVLRYDRRGYGHSLATGPAPSFATQVDDLARIVGDRPAVIVGHSLGGVVALALAQRTPNLVRSVVAYEAPMSWLPWWPTVTAGAAAIATDGDAGAAAERFMRRIVGDDRWEALPERTQSQRRAEGPALLAELQSVRDASSPPYDPASLTVPVIAAHGTRSAPHHQRAAQELARSAPDARLVVVEGADHGVHLSAPAALADLARQAVALADERG